MATGAFFCPKAFLRLGLPPISNYARRRLLVTPPISPPLSGWRPRRSPAPGPYWCRIGVFLGQHLCWRHAKQLRLLPPTRSTSVPSGPDWLHEVKYDGEAVIFFQSDSTYGLNSQPSPAARALPSSPIMLRQSSPVCLSARASGGSPQRRALRRSQSCLR